MWSRQQRRLADQEQARQKRWRIVITIISGLFLLLLLAIILFGPWGPFKEVLFSKSEKKTEEKAKKEASDEDGKKTSKKEDSTLPSNETATTPGAQATVASTAAPALIQPMDGAPKYPFTKDASIACGHWPQGSLDYPYFGAPRERTRIHAGIDIYPPAGVGTPVKAMKAGKVIKVEVFYTRATGEQTYGVLINHGDFVANYAELQPPSVKVGDAVGQGTLLGGISGTQQLHFEMYTPGTTNWLQWYGAQPANLLDPTAMMLQLYGM